MPVVIFLMAIAILLGLTGSIILVLGLINQKNVKIITGGIMLFFTILFCTAAIFFSVVKCHRQFEKFREHNCYMMAPEGMQKNHCMEMQNSKCCGSGTMMDGSKCQHNDSICNKEMMGHPKK